LTVDVAPLLSRPPVLMDASRQMLDVATRRLAAADLHAAPVNGDAFCLPFAARFDLVYSFRLIRHFEELERQRLYRQIGAVVKPGGLLVFDVVNEVVSRPLREQAAPGDYSHYDALLTREAVRAELAAAGFSIVSLVGVQHRYPTMRRMQILVAPRSRMLARCAMEAVDRTGGQPLEWIVVCRRA
jgi:SAM-dependent methyltransferase